MTLDELRRQVDELDRQIVRLVNERAKVACEIGHLKRRDNNALYVPSREKTVYDNISALNEGPLPDRCLKAVYREIMSGCLALETPLKVAYLGPEGTFTHVAARTKFGDSVSYLPAATLDEVFSEVERGRADHGVVPVENSTGGGIHETLTRFLSSPLKVCAEVLLEIHHALMARCPQEDVRKIYSKGEVLGQTRRWLQEHMPGVALAEMRSTSAAAAQAAAEPDAAAIGSASLAPVHGLRVLADRIEDYAHNATRFFVLGRSMSEPTGNDKTAVLCSVRDKVGALHDLLEPFKEFGINMTKIESFPSPTAPWQYHFFVDFLGHPEHEETQRALQAMEAECVSFKVLGAFARWEG
ncbi:MAG: prephenate dehydratase [Candidatus Brocadiaceae bacterium]|nr:prephenate dehydratase [Candidatus Brocadiaceae bacterium]